MGRLIPFVLMLALSVGAPAHGESDAIRESLTPAMKAYLDGDVDAALAAADAVASRHPDSAFVQNVIRSLRDPLAATQAHVVNADYGADVMRAWDEARATWRDGRRPPAGTVPSVFVTVPESVRSALIVDARSGLSYLLRRRADQWRVDDLYYTSLGRLGIGKADRGDERTPVGIYWVTDRLAPPQLAARYGALAFPLDYPNALDRALGRRGDGIWIHGGPAGSPVRPPRHTDGCIAIADRRLVDLDATLQALTTPVIVAPSINWVAPAHDSRLEKDIRAALDGWLEARRHGDEARFFSMYAEGYRGRFADAASWRAAREVELRATTLTRAVASSLEIYRDPGAADIYLTRFDFEVTSASGTTIRTVKRIYWRREAGRILAVAEGGG